MNSLRLLVDNLALGALLEDVRRRYGSFEVVDHWQQGEFHHDLVLRVDGTGEPALPGPVLVVSTNCNGGVKELLCFATAPTAGALWHARCPGSGEFAGDLPPLLGSVRTMHWFDPAELIRPDARSEYRPEFRERQPGGGWRIRRETPTAACSVVVPPPPARHQRQP